MRFLFIAPRYHTNQIPIMKGLIEHGHEVCFISHYMGNIEDYSYVTPVIAGYSRLFSMFEAAYVKRWKRHDSEAGNMKLKYGFPPFGRIKRIVKAFNPDVIIFRERSVYSIFANLSLWNFKSIKILYNQSPLWEEEIKNDLPHKLVKSLLPSIRMTPVLGNPDKGSQCEKGAVYVPFVMEPKLSHEQKSWFKGDSIRLFCVGKYEKRKNIYMLLEVFAELRKKYPMKLVVAGECVNDFQVKYKKELEKYIVDNDLQKEVELRSNLSRQQIEGIYRETDLFVIPSTREPASISQLEAMAFSIPVICSDTNGTACYIKDGITGYLFKDNQKEDLLKVMTSIVSHKDKLREMGKNSYQEIINSCSYELYYQGICKCIDLIQDKNKRKK